MFNKIEKISIGCTTLCNLDCIYCHQSKEQKTSSGFISDANIEKLCVLLMHLPLADELEIRLLGGEASMFPEDIKRLIKIMRKKVGQKLDINLFFSLATNGTNMANVLKLIKDGYLRASNVTLSWDGIYSSSHSRKPKNPIYSDAFFQEQIRLVGQSMWNKDIHVVYAVTPNTVANMHESLLFQLDNNLTNFTFYFINEGNYINAAFLAEYEKQLYLIGKEFITRYKKPLQRFQYNNWNILYHRKHCIESPSNTMKFAKCRNFGRVFHVDIDGGIYPCVFFGDHKCLKLGELEQGFNRAAMHDFINECLRPLACNYKKCGNLHCHECPGSTYLYMGNLAKRYMNQCHLRTIEKRIFEELFDTSSVTAYQKDKFWCLKDNERSADLYEPGCGLPLYDYEMLQADIVYSDTKEHVATRSWFDA